MSLLYRSKHWALLFSFVLGFTLMSQGAWAAANPDYNGDCQLDVTDYLDFQNGFALQDPKADLDGDGQFLINDILDFQNAFHQYSQRGDVLPGCGGAAAEIPVLVPGAGFDGETPQPDPIGSAGDKGHDARAIARWDVVPFQDIEGVFNVGVVAFHMNGIDRVEVSLDGGPWEAVHDMVLNPRTDVYEYTFAVDTGALPDGRIELRAKVFPKNAGAVRVLQGEIVGQALNTGMHSLVLFNNASGTLPTNVVYVSPSGVDSLETTGAEDDPFKSTQYAAHRLGKMGVPDDVVADGGTIYLLPGVHKLGPYKYSWRVSTQDRYLTIMPAPGVDPADAPLVGSDGSDGLRLSGSSKVRLKDVDVRLRDHRATLKMGSSSQTDFVFSDNVFFDGPGGLEDWTVRTRQPLISVSGDGTKYAINSRIVGYGDGNTIGAFVRNVHMEDLISEMFTGNKLVINSSAKDVHPYDTGAHPDFYQIYAPGKDIENVILYGVSAKNYEAQGFFLNVADRLKDMAFVNVALEKSDTAMVSWVGGQVKYEMDHLLWHNVSHTNQQMIWRITEHVDPSRIVKNISIKNSLWDRMIVSVDVPDMSFALPADVFDNNHYMRSRDIVGYGDPDADTSASATFGPLELDQVLVERAGYTMPVPKPGSIADDRVIAIDILHDINGLLRENPSTLGAIEVK